MAAYVGLGLPAVLTGLISLPLGPVDASAWVSGLAAAAVVLAFLVVRRSFGTAAGPRPAARPLRQLVLPGGVRRVFRAELNIINWVIPPDGASSSR